MRASDRVDYNSLSYLRGRWGADSKEYLEARAIEYGHRMPVKMTPKPRAHEQQVEEAHLVNIDYAQMVNDALSESKKEIPEPQPIAPIAQSLKPQPGESPLEYARRRRAAQLKGNI